MPTKARPRVGRKLHCQFCHDSIVREHKYVRRRLFTATLRVLSLLIKSFDRESNIYIHTKRLTFTETVLDNNICHGRKHDRLCICRIVFLSIKARFHLDENCYSNL